MDLYFLRDRVINKELEIKYVLIEEQTADGFMKAHCHYILETLDQTWAFKMASSFRKNGK